MSAALSVPMENRNFKRNVSKLISCLFVLVGLKLFFENSYHVYMLEMAGVEGIGSIYSSITKESESPFIIRGSKYSYYYYVDIDDVRLKW